MRTLGIGVLLVLLFAGILLIVSDCSLYVMGDPTFGTVRLRAGFTPDPHTVNVMAGGPIDAERDELRNELAGKFGCVGWVATKPDVRLMWSGDSDELQVSFRASLGDDATLIVNLPDGTWTCDDDSGDGLDPLVAVGAPRRGQYDIWVGSYEEGEFVEGVLSISELSAHALTGQQGIRPRTQLDVAGDPTFGTIELRPGFAPDPHMESVVSGGGIDAELEGLPGDCIGWVAGSPDVRLMWSGSTDRLHVFFDSDSEGDATLIVNLPDGAWTCDDDSGDGLDPLVAVPWPEPGQYDIWVGSYDEDGGVEGELGFSEISPIPSPSKKVVTTIAMPS